MDAVSIILPVYNEEENIRETLILLDEVMKSSNWRYEIIVIESGSTDNSRKIIEKLSKNYRNLKVYFQGSRKGYGNGIREGFSKATKEIVMYTDPDRVLDFNKIPYYLKQLKGYDALIGYKTNKKLFLKRKIYTFGFRLINRFLFDIKDIKDINFSFKIVKREMLSKLNLTVDGWFIDADIVIELLKNNAKIKQVPIFYSLREKGKSNIHFKTIFEILKEMFDYKKRQIQNSKVFRTKIF